MKYKVTLINTTDRNKNVWCVVKRVNAVNLDNKVLKNSLISDGVSKICAKKSWTKKDLTRLSYTRAKVEVYDEVKEEQRKADNYALIKAIKYSTGEWKRPKSVEELKKQAVE